MDNALIRALLEDLISGQATVDQVLGRLSVMPFQDLGFAKVDHHRALRKGFPEVVYGRGKTPDQIAALAAALIENSDRLLVTKADSDAFAEVKSRVSDAVYSEVAHTIVVDRRRQSRKIPGVMVVSAGTSDLPVAMEAAITADLMDCQVDQVNDVGVAGIHRLLSELSGIREARVVIAVAGMEGALPSVVGGLVESPVIAVPTSVGYGASFGGLAALLAMLNSCAPGVTVVNIDNGFGAGYFAALILRDLVISAE